MSRGIRARITSLSTIAVLLVLVAAAFALVTAQREVLTDSVDEVLDRQASTVTRLIEQGDIPRVIPGQGDDESFAIVTDRDRLRLSSTDDPPVVTLREATSGRVQRFSLDPLADSATFRLRVSAVGAYTLTVGTPLDDVDESVTTLTRGLVIAVPLVSAALAVLVWLTVGRVLAPVERIRRRVQTIGDSNLDERVPDPRTGDEISRLAHTMNDMLARLDASAARQRGFVGDASHELRSPVARIRARLEVDAAYPDGADLLETHGIVLSELDALQSLVEDLLLLAQTDSTSVARREVVDFDDLVLREVAATTAAAGRIDVSGVTAAQVIGHPDRLARIVRNLLHNAVIHGEGRIRVRLYEEGGAAVFVVEDEGPGIPTLEREHIFERFARLDDSRSRGTGGAGLGLSIARQIARGHGGDIRVDSAPSSRGSRFSARLPAAAKPIR